MNENYICLLDGVVQTIIWANADFVAQLLQTGQYDQILPQIQYPNQVIEPGYILFGLNFSPPPATQLPPQQQYEIMVQNAILGFNQIMVQYVAQNIMLGITQAGKTELIADALQTVQRYGQSGSLYAAITALEAVQLTPEMEPYLDATIVANLIAQTQAVIANL
jgi:hypothetical protein